MSSKMSNLARTFLNDLNKLNETIDILNSMLENLEEKGDPSTKEIQLVSDIYQFLEKTSLLKENMRSYLIDGYQERNPGNKLSELFDERGKTIVK